MRLVACLVALLTILWTVDAFALTATWDREADSNNVVLYDVYISTASPCSITDANKAGLKAGTVAQPPAGTAPSFVLPASTVGCVAVDAVDTFSQQSGLSVVVPFSSMGPSIPQNLHITK